MKAFLFWGIYIGLFAAIMLWAMSGWRVTSRRVQFALVGWFTAVVALVLR